LHPQQQEQQEQLFTNATSSIISNNNDHQRFEKTQVDVKKLAAWFDGKYADVSR
jgi:hypothetical protein